MRRLPALLLVGLLAASAAADDVIVLLNGREVRGRVVEETEDAVKIDIGGGRMTFSRSQIRELRRDAAGAPAPGGKAAVPEAPEPASRREEHAVLYLNGELLGTRTFRVTRNPDGFQFDEEVRLLDASGAVDRETRTTERADLQLRPLGFQVRETSPGGFHRTFTGEVRTGRLLLTVASGGEKEKREVASPTDARFPLAARELFLRESRALGGKLDAPVFDVRDAEFHATSYRELGPRPTRIEGRSLLARLIVRKYGLVEEREWLDVDGSAVVSELRGGATVAIAAAAAAVERLARGDGDRVTGPGSSARTHYVDAIRGWRIAKPDPTWTFEEPAAKGTGALLVVRNEPIFASVDVMLDPEAKPGSTLEDAAEALQRACRAVAPDFRVASDGTVDRGGVRFYWLEASATTKGEATTTLARVAVREGRVYRLLAACPTAGYEMLKPDLEKILDSFKFD